MHRTLTKGMAVFGAGVAVVALGNTARADEPALTPLGVFDSGADDEGGSEIVAVDTFSDRMFITNGFADRIDIVDISDPRSPKLVDSVDALEYGSGIQSVAVGHKVVAAAVAGEAPGANGTVITFDVDGHDVTAYEVGVLPDSIAFTPNGRYIVVANEAEPTCVDGVGDPEGSISIIDTRKGTVATAGFEDWIGAEDALRRAGVRIFFPGSNAAQDLEPEYVTIANNSRTAYVTLQENNAIAVVDIKSATVTDILPLGFKDHSISGRGFDPTNRPAGAEVIGTWNVMGMYMPDAIAFADLASGKFLVTANEGDARDWPCYSEEIRIGDFAPSEGSELDDGTVVTGLAVPPYTPDNLELENENLGRLNSTTAFPTSANDAGEIEQLYSYGARSFTIWGLDGSVVFDSGDQFEQRLLGTPFYNLDDDETDGRSDDKGPEPEALALGEVDGRTYAFIGLERSGGVMMYDITDPTNATFVDYVNTAEVENGVATEGGDVGPEGIAFVPADKSPNGEALIAVSYEISGTTRLFQVN